MLFDLGFELFVVLSDPLHQIFEHFVRGGALLVWVHHIDQGFLVFVVFDETDPSGFVVYVARTHTLLDELAQGVAVLLLFHLFVPVLLLFVLLFLLEDVLGEFIQPIVIM